MVSDFLRYNLYDRWETSAQLYTDSSFSERITDNGSAPVKDILKGPLELSSPRINEDLPALNPGPNSTQVYVYDSMITEALSM